MDLHVKKPGCPGTSASNDFFAEMKFKQGSLGRTGKECFFPLKAMCSVFWMCYCINLMWCRYEPELMHVSLFVCAGPLLFYWICLVAVHILLLALVSACKGAQAPLDLLCESVCACPPLLSICVTSFTVHDLHRLSCGFPFLQTTAL